ncbi:MAG: DUF2007 domain-containing protein [Acidobacteria bacterium]|nr:DUF2007 domain-containing protein [Acidobacteriota bacterium]
MPYCPSCGVEYREGFTRCSDCDVELVAALPPDEGQAVGDESWVAVAAFTTDEAAGLALGFLRGEGLRAEVLDKMMHVQPYGMGLLGEVVLMVPESEAARARELLAEADLGGVALAENSDAENPSPDKEQA